MRKFLALALAVLMLVALAPTAMAKAGDITAVKTDTVWYHADDGAITDSFIGGTAVVQTPYANFVNWQVAGSILTGAETTWNKWIRLTTTLKVEGAGANEVYYIDGTKYTTDANGQFTVVLYFLPAAGGNSQNRTLTVTDKDYKNPKYVSIGMVYIDELATGISVRTIGTNQANTNGWYDSDNSRINIDTVFTQLIPVYTGSYSTGDYRVNYYPIRMEITFTDTSGNKLPAFTRVDIANDNGTALTYYNNDVTNWTSVYYLDENSNLTIEKRFYPGASAADTLDYDKALLALVAYAKEYGVGAGLIGDAFNANQYNTWTAANIAVAANMTAIQNNLDALIAAIYTAQTGSAAGNIGSATYFGGYAAGASTAGDATYVIGVGEATLTALQVYMTGAGTYADLVPANYTSLNAANQLAAISAVLKAYSTNSFFVQVANTNRAAKFFDAAAAAANGTAPASVIAAYKAEIDALTVSDNKAYIADNWNLMYNTIDKLTFTFSTPSTMQTIYKKTLSIRYNSVTRISSSGLVSLEGQNVTVAPGESVQLNVTAKQNLVPVTGYPIKYKSNDTSIATVDAATGKVTGVKAGVTFVTAYLDTANDKAEAIIIVTVAEPAAVVEPTPEVVTTDYVCNVRLLNVRTGPGTSNSKVGTVSRNDVVKVIEVVNGWAKIVWGDGEAYASLGNGKYLKPR